MHLLAEDPFKMCPGLHQNRQTELRWNPSEHSIEPLLTFAKGEVQLLFLLRNLEFSGLIVAEATAKTSAKSKKNFIFDVFSWMLISYEFSKLN